MRRLIAPSLALALTLTACGGDAEPVPDPPPPEELVQNAADAMSQLVSARFEMFGAGAAITISGLDFERAVGRYAAPDAADAILTMRGGDLTIELGTISIGSRTWLVNPLTGKWEELGVGTGFNPATMFDAEDGWRAVLLGLESPTIGETQQIHGARRWVLTGTLPADQIETLTAGIAGGEAVPVIFFIDPATSRLIRIEFSTTGENGVSDWVIEMSNFDEPVTIEPPPAG
jgi:hypothetical protein